MADTTTPANAAQNKSAGTKDADASKTPAKVRIRILCNGLAVESKDEFGERVRTRYFTGDVVEVTPNRAKQLLSMEVGGRKMYEEATADSDDDSDNDK